MGETHQYYSLKVRGKLLINISAYTNRLCRWCRLLF